MSIYMNVLGEERELATTLRVAYKIQETNDHKSYVEVLSGIDTMPVEKQLDILYAAFECANPILAKEITRNKFRDYCLDNLNLQDMMGLLQKVIYGIMGKSDEAIDLEGALTAIESDLEPKAETEGNA